jgi:hypothetical protein
MYPQQPQYQYGPNGPVPVSQHPIGHPNGTAYGPGPGEAPTNGPWPQQPYAQPAPQAAPQVMPNIVEPGSGRGEGEWTPRDRNLIGRAVLIIPTSIDENNSYGGNVRPQVTADVIVVNLDENGQPLGPITYGENLSRNPSEQRPPCFSVDAPVISWRGMWVNSAAIVPTLRDVLAQRGVTLGRIVQGEKTTLLNRLADNDPARQMLTDAWANRDALKAQPVEINGGPPKKVEQPAPAQPGSQYGQAGGMPGYPAQPAYAQQPAAQVNYGQPAMPPAPGGMPMPPVPPAPQAPALGPNAIAAGWTLEAFNAQPPAAQQAILAAG